nr:hypothetical protein [Tanacetum cinerariifolium]
VNDVTRLQALVDKKKVVVTEATIREALHLDDAEAFFSSQWKFLIHTILQCKSAKRTSWNEFSSSMASAVICLSIGKGFSGVETPLFEGMLIEQEVDEEGDAAEHVKEVTAGDAAHGVDSVAHGEVPTVTQELSIPSPAPPTPPLQPPQDLPSTSQLKRRVKKLKKRNNVRVLKLRRLQRVGTSQRVDTFDDTVMDDESNQGRMIAEMDQDDAVVLKDDKEEDKEVVDKDVEEAKEDETEPTEVQEVVDVVTTAKLITKVVTAASETVTAASAIIPTAELKVPAATLTAAPARVAAAPSSRKKGVVIRDPEEESTTSTIIPAKTKSKDKGKGILDEAIDHVKRKAKEDPAVKRYQAMKRKPQTEAQARKNMMMHLKNVVGFKMDYFKGMSYDDIQRAAKRRKLDEEVEELRRHLQIMPNEDDDVYTEATPLARKVPVVDYHVIEMNNKPYYKIIRADDTHQLYISFLSLLRNFDRKDLEALWRLVKEKFSITKPKNFSEDFLLVTLGAMFEKPDIYAQI